MALYASVSSYQDSGTVRVIPGSPELIADSESRLFRNASLLQDNTFVSFKTHYARPRLFRLDWHSAAFRTSREAVIWSNGKRAYRWAPLQLPERDGFTLFSRKDLRMFFQDALKSSGGSVFLVPTLLMKDATYVSFADYLTDMTELSILREERLDGEQCYVIKGKVDTTPWVLWVEKKSYLLRKVRTLYTSSSFHETLKKGSAETFIAEEVHSNIIINQKIPAEVFSFKPRLEAHDVDLTR